MEILVWVLVGIFLLNVVVVGWLVVLELVERHRLNKEIQEVDALWRSLTTPLSAATAWGARHRRGFAVGGPSIHKPSARRGPIGRASVGIAVAATIVWVVAALGPAGRQALTSADGLRASSQGQGASRRTGASLAPRVDGTAGSVDSPRVQGGGSPASIATSSDAAVPATVAAEPDSSTAIFIDWAAVTAANGYEVERREEATDQRFLSIATVGESQTAYTDVGLDSGTTYFYRVSALTDAGAAPPSAVVSATTAVSPPAATTVTADATTDSITLRWTDVADETGYRVERSIDGEGGWVEIGTTGQDVTVYVNVALSPGTRYHYRIVATNSGGDSLPSNTAAATTEIAPSVEAGGGLTDGGASGSADVSSPGKDSPGKDKKGKGESPAPNA